MRILMVSIMALSLLAGSASKASAQGLVEYALILVLTYNTGAPVVAQVQASGKLQEDCEAGSGPAALCAAIRDIKPEMSGAEGMARLSRAGATLVGTAAVRKSRPLLIIAEDVEGEALATQGTTPPPYRPIADVLFQKIRSDGAVGLVGCDLSVTPIVAFVQENGGDGVARSIRPETNSDAEICADALQSLHLVGSELTHVVQQVTPISRTKERGITIATAHVEYETEPGSDSTSGVTLEEVTIAHEYIVRVPI